jgi:hypothetical protein
MAKSSNFLIFWFSPLIKMAVNGKITITSIHQCQILILKFSGYKLVLSEWGTHRISGKVRLRPDILPDIRLIFRFQSGRGKCLLFWGPAFVKNSTSYGISRKPRFCVIRWKPMRWHRLVHVISDLKQPIKVLALPVYLYIDAYHSLRHGTNWTIRELGTSATWLSSH